MTDLTIYHNPKCSKSRQTLELIKDRNPTIIEYLKTPLTVEELLALGKKLGMHPREFLRTKEDAFLELKGALNLDDDHSVAEAMARIPQLMERPIVTLGQRGVIGRPPENVLALLS